MTDHQKLIEAAAALLREGNAQEAKNSANKILLLYPDEPETLLLLNTICRIQGRVDEALSYAMKVATLHPEHFDGHARAAQDLMTIGSNQAALYIISNGLARHPDSPWVLLTAMRVNLVNGFLEEAITLGLTLHKIDPCLVDQYDPLLAALAAKGRKDEAMTIMNKALSLFPDSFHLIHLKACLLGRLGMDDECRWFLYAYIQRREAEHERRMLTEELYHLETRKRQQLIAAPRRLACDIVCIASDEAPYIHEFVHHHLFMGFANIYIGLNNCADSTRSIVQKVAQYCDNVHILDVDDVIQDFKQWGCYHRIFDYAQQRSSSSHCLFLDVDEFWISSPFPASVEQFLRENIPFDVYSFYWLCAHNDKEFAGPLDARSVYQKSNWVKSLFSYDCSLARIGVHGPVLNSIDGGEGVKIGGEINRSVSLSTCGLEVCGYNLDPRTSVDLSVAPLVIHMINRSEVEYAYRLFKVHANDDRNSVSFKSNRYGWEDPGSVSGVALGSLLDDSSISRLGSYHRSLARFTEACDISGLVAQARSSITKQQVLSMIENIPFDILNRQMPLIRQIFRGTTFLSVIESMNR